MNNKIPFKFYWVHTDTDKDCLEKKLKDISQYIKDVYRVSHTDKIVRIENSHNGIVKGMTLEGLLDEFEKNSCQCMRLALFHLSDVNDLSRDETSFNGISNLIPIFFSKRPADYSKVPPRYHYDDVMILLDQLIKELSSLFQKNSEDQDNDSKLNKVKELIKKWEKNPIDPTTDILTALDILVQGLILYMKKNGHYQNDDQKIDLKNYFDNFKDIMDNVSNINHNFLSENRLECFKKLIDILNSVSNKPTENNINLNLEELEKLLEETHKEYLNFIGLQKNL
ncbi:MAG: hypothetical protein HQK65_13590 [Desulfamplus sp.]|nr:hypothetical protein [Desulfamplus sp.]